MPFVLRFVAPAGQTTNMTPAEGAYLESFNPEAYDGRGVAEWTTDAARAARFPTREAAVRAWHGVPNCRPVRPDGRPNKPLTAYSLAVEPVDA